MEPWRIEICWREINDKAFSSHEQTIIFDRTKVVGVEYERGCQWSGQDYFPATPDSDSTPYSIAMQYFFLYIQLITNLSLFIINIATPFLLFHHPIRFCGHILL